jgi:hypothetical protein
MKKLISYILPLITVMILMAFLPVCGTDKGRRATAPVAGMPVISNLTHFPYGLLNRSHTTVDRPFTLSPRTYGIAVMIFALFAYPPQYQQLS